MTLWVVTDASIYLASIFAELGEMARRISAAKPRLILPCPRTASGWL
jgi:hypothetical protein